MSKYTPGPWHVDGGWGVYALGRHVAFCGQMTEYSGLQLNVDGADCANAHLIAAAPDLLAACEAALRISELWCPSSVWPVENEGEAQALLLMKRTFEAAIAKAKGGTDATLRTD